MTDRVLTLPDGRLLETRVTGPADGEVLLYHHGTPGARIVPRPIERAAHERGLRVVSWSRPTLNAAPTAAGESPASTVPAMASSM